MKRNAGGAMIESTKTFALANKLKLTTALLHRSLQTLAVIGVLCTLAACSSGTDAIPVDSQTLEPGDSILLDSVDSGRNVFDLYPDTVELKTSEATQLRLAYTEQSQITESSLPYVDSVWVGMSDCLGIQANPPLVILKAMNIEPVSSSDDTIFDFQMLIAASAHDVDGASDIQILASDLDQSGESGGFYLRSILGRYLWRSNQLAERDYDYSCAASS